jgi:DNA-binding transcriptional LysR family regulator
LRVFEVAARHLSCTSAAKELCLTVSAVSKQLQVLENHLGVELFNRTKSGLVLTQPGRVYLEGIQPAMVQLAEAGMQVAHGGRKVRLLKFSVMPAFADRWLIPRYGELLSLAPDFKFQLSTDLVPDDHFPFSFDAYVRVGEGTWPGCVADYICGKRLILVGSPALLAKQGPISAPADLARFALLKHVGMQEAWDQAFDELQVSPHPNSPVLQWEYYSLLIRSASEGNGLALIPECFISKELASGDLVPVLSYSQMNSRGYYFIFSNLKRHDPLVARLRKWLLSHRAKDADGG